MLLVVAEYAAANPDGTFTVVRGGVENWFVPNFPADLGASVLIEMPGHVLPQGFNQIRVSVRDPLQRVVFHFTGSALILDPSEKSRAVVHFVAKVAVPGPLTIDAAFGLVSSSYVVNVQQAEVRL